MAKTLNNKSYKILLADADTHTSFKEKAKNLKVSMIALLKVFDSMSVADIKKLIK